MTEVHAMQEVFDDVKLLEIVRSALWDAIGDGPVGKKVRAADTATPLLSLGIDSLTAMEVLAYVEDRTGVIVPGDFDEKATIGDLIELLKTRLSP